jgi:hypothetical protein
LPNSDFVRGLLAESSKDEYDQVLLASGCGRRGTGLSGGASNHFVDPASLETAASCDEILIPNNFLKQRAEFFGGFAGVSFLDDSLREYLTYGLREVEPGRLFLRSLTSREFIDGTDTVKSGATFVFQEDGTVRISKQSFQPHVSEVAESRVDVKDHYLPWPEFGDYARLIDIQKLELFPPMP